MGLDSVELLLAFEEAFAITISDDAAARIRTPRDVIDLVMQNTAGRTREDVAAEVRRITLEQLGNVDYGEDQRFVEDMGID